MSDNAALGDLADGEIAAMPLDRLALLILDDAKRTNTWSWHNWLNEYSQRPGTSNDAQARLPSPIKWLLLGTYTRAS
jgi:hypothetical protein